MRMKIKISLILLLLLMTFSILGQSIPPKRELRGAWIALVRNEDWPSEPGLSTEQQKYELDLILDELQSKNINAVFFHIRPECDAIYQSNFEPWSYWLTGQQGVEPNPFYDPLQYAIDEAHKRGMELHAWFNPYRAVSVSGTYQTDPNHISNTQPNWIIQINNYKFLDPGLPQVRDYSVQVILDVVNNYDIDGVHLDDYFYPYPPNQITNQDTSTFNLYPRGHLNIDDWRRDNVNLMIQMIGDSIFAEKPYLKYGVSPFGIWKSGVPAGIVGLDAYNVIFCDAVAWLSNQWLDYLIPQLYWPFGGSQDYGTLLPWWTSQMNNRHLYSGMAFYKGFSTSEYGNQIDLNRTEPNCYGSVFFKSSNFLYNQTVSDFLQNNHFKFKSLIPEMIWKSNGIPNAPQNLTFGDLGNERGDGLMWDYPDTSGGAEEAFMFAIYKLDSLNYPPAYLENPENIAAISGTNYTMLPPIPVGKTQYNFAVTSLSRNYVESAISNIIQVDINPPGQTILDFPANGATNQPENMVLRWLDTPHSSFSKIQISEDSSFSSIFFEKEGIRDTFIVVSGFTGQSKYYWKVNSSNIAGEGQFSDTWHFITGFPIPPILSEPPHATMNVPIRPTFKWFQAVTSTSYNLQVILGTLIIPSSIVIDSVLADTVCTINADLLNDKIYTWRVSSSNTFGFGGWSSVFGFKTVLGTGIISENDIPKKFNLLQNFPNPFNPKTTIKYALPNRANVKLELFDIQGRKVNILLDEEKPKGFHTIKFDGSNLSSGVYLYKIQADQFVQIRKLLLIK